MGAGQGSFRVGTSGYQYEHWRGPFYPQDMAKNRWFDYYAQRFDTVEINNTFYHLPEARTFEAWRRQAPRGFLYVLKFSRYGSHLKRLRDPHETIAAFLERAEHLGPLLGPILVQLPPRWRVNPERLAGFLAAAPSAQRWALEVRDPSWLCEEVYDLLAEHNAALCIHDMIAEHPQRVTADWTYLRYHGDHYRGSYSRDFLLAEARRIRGHLSAGRDVFAYFNNDEAGYAVRNALELRGFVQDG